MSEEQWILASTRLPPGSDSGVLVERAKECLSSHGYFDKQLEVGG